VKEKKPQISRVERTKEEARANYNRLSRWYDLLAGSSERKYRDEGLEKLDAGEGETVVEIGFGTGHALVALARSVGTAGHVFGIDLSEGMAEVSRSRLREAGLAERVGLACGDGAHLPFASSRADAIFMSFTLELFDTPEMPVVLRECRRVLREEGRIAVVSLSRQNGTRLAVRLYEWAHHLFPTAVDCRPIYLRRSLQATGFEVLDSTRMTMWGLPVEIALARRASTGG